PAAATPGIQFAAHLDRARRMRRLRQAALVGERDHQRLVAQRTAVVPQEAGAVALERERLLDRLAAALAIALQRQRQSQVQQRQRAERVLAVVVVQRAQGAEWRA